MGSRKKPPNQRAIRSRCDSRRRTGCQPLRRRPDRHYALVELETGPRRQARHHGRTQRSRRPDGSLTQVLARAALPTVALCSRNRGATGRAEFDQLSTRLYRAAHTPRAHGSTDYAAVAHSKLLTARWQDEIGRAHRPRARLDASTSRSASSRSPDDASRSHRAISPMADPRMSRAMRSSSKWNSRSFAARAGYGRLRIDDEPRLLDRRIAELETRSGIRVGNTASKGAAQGTPRPPRNSAHRVGAWRSAHDRGGVGLVLTRSRRPPRSCPYTAGGVVGQPLAMPRSHRDANVLARAAVSREDVPGG